MRHADAGPDTPRHGRGKLWLLAAAAWLVAVAGGFGLLLRYDATPGENPEPPAVFVGNPAIRLATAVPTLLLFAHPQCPCTRATLAEFDRLMATCTGRVAAHVVFSCEAGVPTDEASTALWEHARRIPGVSVHLDRGGALARTFHAVTSGAVLLYEPDGALAFHGGITGGRGHEGDNTGHAAVVALLTGTGRPFPAVTEVFGCPLCDDRDPAAPPPEPR